jgi:hypothetical protein
MIFLAIHFIKDNIGTIKLKALHGQPQEPEYFRESQDEVYNT